jgi:outer membrane protein OmpA-like peptidoglycan-associated protein
VCAIAGAVLPVPASAESGDLNAHFQLGFGAPVTGELSSPDLVDGRDRLVPAGWLGIDWQFERPFAIEAMFGLGYQVEQSNQPARHGDNYWSFTLGARWRPLDDAEGYATEASGNVLGNLWIAAHLGYYAVDDVEFGFDVSVGYQLSVVRPLQVGVFLSSALVPDAGGYDGAHLFVWGGIDFSLSLLGDNAPADSDDDGLPDDREETLGTNPEDSDSDDDGLPDGLETAHDTDPLVKDTDGDGLDDGEEDADHDGAVDDDETDPRDADTDGGGVTDGTERSGGTDPRNPQDDRRDEDLDGVPDDGDDCPDTLPNTEVNPRGCAILARTISLQGIQFGSGSAEILGPSENTLQRGLMLLRQNPGVRIEIAGHTDDRGSTAVNVRLSRARADAVRRWLIDHGIEARRLEVRGYGESDPVASNDDEEGRARNRRIEFRRLD